MFGIGQIKNCIRQPFLEGLIVAKLFEKFRVVRKKLDHYSLQSLIMFNSGVLFIRVLNCILVSSIRPYFRWNFLAYYLAYLVRVFPVDAAELVIERFNDIAQVIQFRFRFSASTTSRHWANLGVLIRQRNLECRFDFNTITIHIYCLQNTTREVLFLWSGKFGNEKV